MDQRLSAPERVDLMGNAQALSSAGKLPASDALGLVETFHADPERQVVQRPIDLAFAPQSHLVPDNLMPNYRRFLLKNFQARAHELGWTPKPGESDDIRLLRPSLVAPSPPQAAIATFAAGGQRRSPKSGSPTITPSIPTWSTPFWERPLTMAIRRCSTASWRIQEVTG